jgi:hypothetical protein
LRKIAEKPRSPIGIVRIRTAPVVRWIVIVPAAAADSSACSTRSTVPSVLNVIAVVPVSVFVSVTIEPAAERPVIVTVIAVSPAALDSAWIVSFAAICVKSGRRSVSIAPPTVEPSTSTASPRDTRRDRRQRR